MTVKPIESQYPRRVWVTATEFARMMGKSRMWANRAIRSGLAVEAGFRVLHCSSTWRGGSRGVWYIQVPSDL